MNGLKENKEAFYSRFGIKYNTPSDTQLKKEFKNYIENIIYAIDEYFDTDIINVYCGRFGFKTSFSFHGDDKNIYNCITEENNFHEYLFKLEMLLKMPVKTDIRKSQYNDLIWKIEDAFDSTYLPISIIKTNDNYLVIPEGCSFLDKNLIIKTLKFLGEKSHKQFIQGLNEYQEKKYISCAEKMRRTAEEFLREIFNNNQGLDKNINIILIKIKSNSPKEPRNIIHKVFKYLDDFYNENSKHQEGDITKNDCEFIIYQTGSLLRYISEVQLQ